jgi:hypothetical protein
MELNTVARAIRSWSLRFFVLRAPSFAVILNVSRRYVCTGDAMLSHQDSESRGQGFFWPQVQKMTSGSPNNWTDTVGQVKSTRVNHLVELLKKLKPIRLEPKWLRIGITHRLLGNGACLPQACRERLIRKYHWLTSEWRFTVRSTASARSEVSLSRMPGFDEASVAVLSLKQGTGLHSSGIALLLAQGVSTTLLSALCCLRSLPREKSVS